MSEKIKYFGYADLYRIEKEQREKEAAATAAKADHVDHKKDQIDQVDHKADQIPSTDQPKIEVTSVLSIPGTQYPGKPTEETEYPREVVTPVTSTPETHYPGDPSPKIKNYRDPGYHCPNWLDDEILPKLQLSEQVVLRRLFRLSYGFNRQITDSVSVSKLAEKCNLSDKGVKLAIRSLEEKGLITAHRDFSGNNQGGNRYEVLTRVLSTPGNKYPGKSVSPEVSTHIKDHDDHDLKEHDHHQNAHARETMMIYQSITGNSWSKADQTAYQKIKHLPIETIEHGIKITLTRATGRPGSLAYFVKEILAIANPAPASIAQRRRELQAIITRVRTAHTGQAGYSIADFSADVKDICAREGVVFDHALFNELLG